MVDKTKDGAKKTTAKKSAAKKKSAPKKIAQKIGRPTKMTPERIETLKKCYLAGFTDQQACFYAEISENTLHVYCDKHPDFREWKEAAKKNPAMIAKMNLLQSLKKGDKDISKFILERTEKENYSTRSEHTGADGGGIVIVDDIPKDE